MVAEPVAAGGVRGLAADLERLNEPTDRLEREPDELLARHGTPVAGPHGAETTVASALIGQARDVRRFRGRGGVARDPDSASRRRTR